jgi:hypothetical protein
VGPLRGIILCDLHAGKNSNLEKNYLPESPIIEITYHI